MLDTGVPCFTPGGAFADCIGSSTLSSLTGSAPKFCLRPDLLGGCAPSLPPASSSGSPIAVVFYRASRFTILYMGDMSR